MRTIRVVSVVAFILLTAVLLTLSGVLPWQQAPPAPAIPTPLPSVAP